MKIKGEKIVVSGKRKSSVARAVVSKGSGNITINRKPYTLLPELKKLMIEEPLRIAKDVLGKIPSMEPLMKSPPAKTRRSLMNEKACPEDKYRDQKN